MPAVLRAFVFLAAALLSTLTAAQAQDRVWLQIEAQPRLDTAQERAEAYAGVFPETNGFRLRSGWYAIVLGPYAVAEGAARLNSLKAENLIPSDSFIADGASFADQFWPVAGAAPAVEPTPLEPPAVVTEEALPEIAPEVAPEPVAEPEETPQQARASEAALSEEDRKLLQESLQWFGFYDGGIDGAFGRGTRGSMAAWQEAMGLEPTGILTTRERATLVTNYQAEVAEYGFAEVTEAEAGISVTMPLALVEFDHYEPPFVHFREKAGSGLTLVLISQPGDAAALSGLYDVLQTLKAMPTTGERAKGDTEFRIHGTSATIESHAWAQAVNGTVKGFMLISTPATAERDARIIEVMEASFKSTGATALDPGMVPMEESARRGLLAGLEVRTPKFSRSGFFVDASGSVVTTAEAVAGCSRITLEREVEATVTASADGLALLTPAATLSPPAVAEFQLTPDRIGAEVSVAGYSYEDRLPAPVLTFGTLEESTGLDGNTAVKRLALTALPGDAGGPVVDGTGAVLGLLLPAADGTGQQLPPGVAFAASATTVTTFLKGAGLTIREAALDARLAPTDLTAQATGMTVLVSCWK
jgi:S1-C subfamily serine protease